MRTQVKVVRFTLIMSIALAIITYLITLNIEIGFLCLNTPWLSNNFALTVCGGAFASMLVVLIGETQKYFLNKKSAEDFMFSHTAFIYSQLNILKTHIQFCITNPDQMVPGKLLDYTSGIIKNEITMVSNVDYFSFFKNQLTKEYQSLCRIAFLHIEKYLSSTANLEIAVNSDQINNLQNFGRELSVTSKAYYTGKTLRILDKNLVPLIEEIDLFLRTFDKLCNERYEWNYRREAMLANWNNTPTKGFEEFIKQGDIQL